MAQVVYICKRTVVSTKPVQPGKHYDLSVIGRQMEKTHVRMVYYYRWPRREAEVGEITKMLRESLSETLTHFPTVTGRLVKDDKGHWMIKFNDAGVRMVEAKAKGSVDDWLRCVNREKELKLVHWEDMFHKPYFWSTFYVQITEFEEGGLAIGLSCSHLLADPTCAAMFIKAWADTTLVQKIHAPPCFHPPPLRRPSNEVPSGNPHNALINHYKSLIENSTPSRDAKHTTIALLFSDHMVRACMSMAQTVSPFEAVAGLLWICISKVKCFNNGLVNMSICTDARKVLGLDTESFGNYMVYNKVPSEGLEAQKLQEAASAVAEVVAKMGNHGVMELFEWLEHSEGQSPLLINNYDLICANLEAVDPYSMKFVELLNPIYVSYYMEPVIGIGQVLILPAPAGDGPFARVVMVTLPEDEAVKLCEDELILQFSPTILMGVTKGL